MKDRHSRKHSDSSTRPLTDAQDAARMAKAVRPYTPKMIGWNEAMEYEIKGAWVTWAFFNVSWKWVRRLAGWYVTRRFARKYARYVAMKTMTPVNPPR